MERRPDRKGDPVAQRLITIVFLVLIVAVVTPFIAALWRWGFGL